MVIDSLQIVFCFTLIVFNILIFCDKVLHEFLEYLSCSDFHTVIVYSRTHFVLILVPLLS